MAHRQILPTILIILSCAGLNADRRPSLRVGIHQFPLSTNPVYITDETSQAVANKIYESLFFPDLDGRMRGQLAESYRIEAGGRRIALRLVENRMFSDGTRLQTDDVIATLRLCRDERFGYPYASSLAFIRRLERIDARILRIHLHRPLATWKLALTVKILNRHAIRAADPDTFKETRPAGTGLYRLETVDAPERLRLARNPYRPEGAIHPVIEYRVLAEPHLAPLKLMAGELDICGFPPGEAAVYERKQRWKREFWLLRYRKHGFTYLVFNLREPAVAPGIRRLFYNRLICGSFVNRFLDGRGVTIDSPFMLLPRVKPPQPFPVDPLSKPVRLSILTNAESKLRREFVLFLCQEMAASGLQLEPRFLEYQAFLQSLKSGRFQLAVSGFLLDVDNDLSDIFSSKGFFNYSGLKDDRMDGLLLRGLREMDEHRRTLIYYAAHDRWLEHLPLIPLFDLYYHSAVRKEICLPERQVRLIGSAGDFLQNIAAWRPSPGEAQR